MRSVGNMERGKLWLCSGALRVALVLAMAQLLSFPESVQSQTADSRFCERFAVPYGYNCHQYTTITIDGFLLAAHRITNKPRTTSKREATTTAEAPAPMPPLCVTTADQPFESISDFFLESGQPDQSSRSTTLSNCIPVAPTPPISGTIQEGAASATDNRGSSPSTKVTKGHRVFRNPDPSVAFMMKLSSPEGVAPEGVAAKQTTESVDEVVELPGPQPDTQPESDDGDLTPETAYSPSNSGVVAEAGEPVLLMHHEFHNGNSWFIHLDDSVSDQLLPFLLLNAGFDVWVGHQRATYYAHDHVMLTPQDQSYWNWTWDEHAKYDMPALLDLVKMETGSTVHFVGISQSATAGAAAATMPFVTPVLRSLTLIGPTIYRGNTTSHTLNAWVALSGSNPDREFQNGAFNVTTESNSILSGLGPVSALLTDVSGPNCCLGSKYKVKFNNGWDGTTSFKNLMHYQQCIRTNTWSHFDYGGVVDNSLAYNGSPLPPIYDPADIPATLPLLVIYGGRDNIAPPGGVRQFVSNLISSPHSNSSTVLLLPEYAHFDLFYSVNRTQDVFIPILGFLERQRTLQ